MDELRLFLSKNNIVDAEKSLLHVAVEIVNDLRHVHEDMLPEKDIKLILQKRILEACRQLDKKKCIWEV